MALLVLEGSSQELDATMAVAEATCGWPETTPPDLVLAFSSPVRPAAQVAAELARRFPESRIVGCTTAGEHLSGRHSQGGLVIAGLRSPRLRWATGLIEDVATADQATVLAVVDRMFEQLGAERAVLDPTIYFCLCFIDGLSGKEEAVTSMIAEALDGVAVLGGSAGDDMAFRSTEVIFGSTARRGAAVLVLCESRLPFSIFKHQHFRATPVQLAVTRADPPSRRVYEIDGLPAAEAYARALGLSREALDAATVSVHPMAFCYQHELYVRSIQRIHDDGSISFYCAIEEGMVVDVCRPDDLVSALSEGLAQAHPGSPADFLFGANCVLRSVEAAECKQETAVGAIFRSHAHHMIGFDTYGEQLNGLHINQTLVALALRDKTEPA